MGNPFVNNDRDRDEIKLVHFGVSTHIKKSILNLKASKKINQADIIKYKIALDRKINELSIHIFLVGNEQESGVGMGLSYSF